MKYLKLIKTKYLFYYFLFALGMAYFGFWWLAVWVFGLILLGRGLLAGLKYSGLILKGVWEISNSRTPLKHPFLSKKIF